MARSGRNAAATPHPAPHKPAELYQLPDKFDDMSQVEDPGKWYAEWTGEGEAEDHITAESAGMPVPPHAAADPFH